MIYGEPVYIQKSMRDDDIDEYQFNEKDNDKHADDEIKEEEEESD